MIGKPLKRLLSTSKDHIMTILGSLDKGRLVGQRTVDQGRLVNGRLIKRTIRQRTIGQTPLQRRNKRDTL